MENPQNQESRFLLPLSSIRIEPEYVLPHSGIGTGSQSHHGVKMYHFLTQWYHVDTLKRGVWSPVAPPRMRGGGLDLFPPQYQMDGTTSNLLSFSRRIL